MSTSTLKPDTAGELPGRRVRFKVVFPCGRNTAEPSGELSVGDVVAVTAGEVRLAVAEIGWTPVPGPLTEVRTSEHGTSPLPPRSSRLSDTADRPAIPCPDQGAT